LSEPSEPFDSFAILELFGHRRLAGRVRSVEVAGAGMFRIDIPASDGSVAATQFYAPAAVFSLTPTTEEVARAAAARSGDAPVTLALALPSAQRWHPFVLDSTTERCQDPATERCGLCGEKPDYYLHHQGEVHDDDEDDPDDDWRDR
jgi:hypothetical protein